MTTQTSERPTLHLLGGFSLVIGHRSVEVGSSGRRVIAFLGLSQRPVTRSRLAQTLWPRKSEDRARANLRSTIWRMPQEGRSMVREEGDFLSLHAHTAIDVAELVEQCHALLESTQLVRRVSTRQIEESLLAGLLPDWDDEWVLVERERLRQLHLHALEALAARLLAAGRPAEAAHASSAAVAGEPLRESAVRLLISAHLASGNSAAATSVFVRHREDLRRELGIDPSARLNELMRKSAGMTLS